MRGRRVVRYLTVAEWLCGRLPVSARWFAEVPCDRFVLAARAASVSLDIGRVWWMQPELRHRLDMALRHGYW